MSDEGTRPEVLGRPSAAGGTGRGRRQGGPGRRLHPRLPRPLTQPGQVPLPSPWPLPGAASSYTCRRIPSGPRSRPVSASLPAFLAARKPSRAPPPTRGQRYNRGFARLPVPPPAQPAPSRDPGLGVRPDHSPPSLAFAWGTRPYRGAFQGLTNSSQPAVLWEARAPQPHAPR